ncbi:hypothetical protein CRG98_014949 [Punica granatum]|uniref:Uncharacterized protein n=1 Tax=Punica granatum TaxID=22663 RepID=A0A2I0K8Z3_PUNGR|nr:hypothetical protein CRG98_014949 [Punica granatum]
MVLDVKRGRSLMKKLVMYSKFLSNGSFVPSASSVESPTNLALHASSNSQHYTEPCTSAPVDVDVSCPDEKSDLLKLRDSINSSLDLHRRWTGLPHIGDESRLSLRNNSIFGALLTLVGLLHLEDVSFSQNGFSGSIPYEYAELPTPTKLELQGNVLVRGFDSNGDVSN